MSRDLIAVSRNPLISLGTAMLNRRASPELSGAPGGTARTILVGRMLAGSADFDLLLAYLLCLSKTEEYAIALIDDPAGPSFKAHPVGLRERFHTLNDDAVGPFIDWRLKLDTTPVIAGFASEAARQLELAVAQLTATFGIPVDVIVLAPADEKRPPLVDKLLGVSGRVIIARPATIRSRFEPSADLEIPVLPKILAQDYYSAGKPLSHLAEKLPPGSRATFLATLHQFSSELEGHLHASA